MTVRLYEFANEISFAYAQRSLSPVATSQSPVATRQTRITICGRVYYDSRTLVYKKQVGAFVVYENGNDRRRKIRVNLRKKKVHTMRLNINAQVEIRKWKFHLNELIRWHFTIRLCGRLYSKISTIQLFTYLKFVVFAPFKLHLNNHQRT